VTFDIASLILASALVLIGFQLCVSMRWPPAHGEGGAPACLAKVRTHGGRDFG
jgi:hypothetical protein